MCSGVYPVPPPLLLRGGRGARLPAFLVHRALDPEDPIRPQALTYLSSELELSLDGTLPLFIVIIVQPPSRVDSLQLHGLQYASPAKNIQVGCHALLQGDLHDRD